VTYPTAGGGVTPVAIVVLLLMGAALLLFLGAAASYGRGPSTGPYLWYSRLLAFGLACWALAVIIQVASGLMS